MKLYFSIQKKMSSLTIFGHFDFGSSIYAPGQTGILSNFVNPSLTSYLHEINFLSRPEHSSAFQRGSVFVPFECKSPSTLRSFR